MMLDIANMFKASRQDSLDREQVIRGEISTAINPLSAQVQHLTNTVQVLRDQLNTNSEYSVDALQEMRAEFRADIEAAKLSVNDPAANAGGQYARLCYRRTTGEHRGETRSGEAQ